MPHGSSLKGLRLNCLLVPGVITALAIVAVVIGYVGLQRQTHQQNAAEVLAQAQLYAGLEKLGHRPSPSEWLELNKQLISVSEIQWDSERFRLLRGAGSSAIDLENPPPIVAELVQRQSAQAVSNLTAAAPVITDDGRTTVIVVLRLRPSPPPDAGTFMVLSGFILLSCIVGGWYLTTRIYRPVMALQEVADDALAGRTTQPRYASDETRQLESSVVSLAERVQAQGNEPRNTTSSAPAATIQP